MEPITHSPSSDSPDWNESYYFVFYDKNKHIGGMSRIGFKPNKREGMTFFFLFLPDGRAAGFHMNDECENYPSKIEVGPMLHQPHEDGTWSYRYKGSVIVVENSEDMPKVRSNPGLISDLLDVELDLTFTPLNEEYEYSKHMTAESLEIGKKSGNVHWEQIASINGVVHLGEERIEIQDAIGQRDHTHGIRDWTGIENWFYFVVWFNDKLAINPAAVVMNDGRMGTGGFLFKDGHNIPLMDMKLTTHEFSSESKFPIKTVLELTDADGVKHILKAKPGAIIPVPFTDNEGRESILVQSFGSFELDGLSGGYGAYETLRRIKE